jgi:EAL domain-containing protein (putative c-di-GMP-specific phosphodiesterase class I)
VEKLRKMGCQYVQGYYYAKPMPAGDFEFYMKKSGEKRAGNA